MRNSVIYTRRQFIDWWANYLPSSCEFLEDKTHPLWIPETSQNFENDAFILLTSPLDRDEITEMYNWAKETNLHPCCYSSGDGEEWWGFNSQDKDNLVLWMLKWMRP
jgi:hypothetical protein